MSTLPLNESNSDYKAASDVQVGDVIMFDNHARKPVAAKIEGLASMTGNRIRFMAYGCYWRTEKATAWVRVQTKGQN
jgi:hypothetical protein